MRIRDPGCRQFGSGIRDGKKSDPESGINIPDPPHWKVQEDYELTAASGTLMRKPVCIVTVERSHRACDRLEVPRPCNAAKVNRTAVKGRSGQISMPDL
jgi:hypothetical protein